MSSLNAEWANRWDEVVEDLERQKQALRCEQERWAEWHAIQEQALLEQVRLVEQREKDLIARERILADTLRALEEDAILLDERTAQLRQERQFFEEEVRKRESQQRVFSARGPKRRPRRPPAYPPPKTPEDDYDSEDFLGDYADEDDWGPPYGAHLHGTHSGDAHETMLPPYNDHLVRAQPPPPPPPPQPQHRGKRIDYRTPTSPVLPVAETENLIGGFDVRVNSPDNTRIHVSYRDPPPAAEPRPRPALVRPAPERGPPERRELLSHAAKVNAGIQATSTDSVRSRIRMIRDSAVSAESESEPTHRASGGGGGGGGGSGSGMRISDIVRTVTPPIMASSSSGEKVPSSVPQPARSTLEHRIKNWVDKLDR